MMNDQNGETNKIDELMNQFRAELKRQNLDITSIDAIHLVRFLQKNGLNNNEIEQAFASINTPIDMDVFETDDDVYTRQRKNILDKSKTIIDKKMNNSMRIVLLNILLPHYKKIKKPRVKVQTTESIQRLVDYTKTYIFESQSNLFERSAPDSTIKKLISIAVRDNYIKGYTKEDVYNIWMRKYGASNNLKDLNALFKDLGGPSRFASSMIRKNKFPSLKSHQQNYVDNVADIFIDFKLVDEIVDYMRSKYNLPIKESLTENVTPAEMSEWIVTWLKDIPKLSTGSEYEEHIYEAINKLSEIYRTSAWQDLRRKVLDGINKMKNSVSRHNIEVAIEKIDSGQKVSTMTEYKIKQLFAEILLNEKKHYVPENID